MGGRFSQQKGKRGELELCQALRNFGYTEVSRIPHWLKGEHQQDVWAKSPGGVLTTFEIKTTSQMPIWISRLQSANCTGERRVGRLSFPDNKLVAFGANPLEVEDTRDAWFSAGSKEQESKFKTLFKKVQGANFLVLKGNRAARFYLKFWNF